MSIKNTSTNEQKSSINILIKTLTRLARLKKVRVKITKNAAE